MDWTHSWKTNGTKTAAGVRVGDVEDRDVWRSRVAQIDGRLEKKTSFIRVWTAEPTSHPIQYLNRSCHAKVRATKAELFQLRRAKSAQRSPAERVTWFWPNYWSLNNYWFYDDRYGGVPGRRWSSVSRRPSWATAALDRRGDGGLRRLMRRIRRAEMFR